MTAVFLKKLIPSLIVCLLHTSVVLASSHVIKADVSYLNFAEDNNSDSLNHLDLNLNYKTEIRLSDRLSFSGEAQAYVATYPDYMLTAPLFEIAYKFRESSFHLGRLKTEHGTYLDTDWVMGIQSSFSRMNPLNPQMQGVTGLAYRFESDQVYINLSGSPISIPDQGVSLDVDSSGVVSSDNPWAVVPPSRALLSTGAELDLKYEVIEDSVPELLEAYQFGGTLGVKTDYLNIFGMYANRPSKQIGFELDAKLLTNAEGLVEVISKPVFRREHFFGVQAESKWLKNFSLNNGFYGLVLIDDDSTAPYQTSHPDYFFITTSLNFKIKSQSFSLRHLYGKARENKKDGVVYIESSRFLYEDSFMLSIDKLNFKGLKSNAELVYSYIEKAARFQIYSKYTVSKKLSLWSQLSLIHDFEEGEVDSENLSISSGLVGFASLDHFNVGASYVF